MRTSHILRLFEFHCVVCSCPDRDSGDLHLWFVLVALTAQSRRADDSTKGDGFQKQKRKGFMAGQVRHDELLVNGQSSGIAWKAFAGSTQKKWAQLAGFVVFR